MTNPYIGEIQLFGFNFAPRDWAFCNGALLSIQQNTALFSLLGISYGGNGQTNFQLPNFVTRAGCEQGQGPGLSPHALGETFGEAAVTLTSAQIPSHNHGINAYSQPDSSKRSGTPAANGGLAFLGSSTAKPFVTEPVNATFAPNIIGPNTGGGLPHENQQPYLALNFCIALQGTYPSFD